MKDFGVGESEGEGDKHPFTRMGYSLLDMGTELGGEFDRLGFGGEIRPVSEEAIKTLIKAGGGVCRECGTSVSRIDKVFLEIERDAPSIALVLTDLWLFDPNDPGRDQTTPLVKPLKTILARGDAIAVLGVDGRYTGPVYDLPPPVDTLPKAKRTRPVFVLAIGRSDLVRNAVETIREGAFSGDKADQLHVTIYDPNVFASASAPTFGYRLAGLEDRIVQAGTVLQDHSVYIDAPQFSVNKAEGDRVRVARTLPDADVAATAGLVIGETSMDLASTFAWEGELEIAGKIYSNLATRPEETCLPQSWVDAEIDAMSEVVSGTVAGPKLQVRFDAAAESLRPLQPGKVLYVAFQATMKALSSPNPASQWMLERSLARADVEDKARWAEVTQREVFPTMNLREFVERLDKALSEQLTGEHVASGGFAFEVK